MLYTLSGARAHKASGNYVEALKHYLVVFTRIPIQDRNQYALEFAETVTGFGNSASTTNLKNLVIPIMELFPGNKEVYYKLGEQCFRHELKSEAYKVYENFVKNYKTNEDMADFRIMMSNITTLLFDSWHVIMLNNENRNRTYADAISKIPNGKLVLEIGSGTGLLSVLCHWNDLDVIAIEEIADLVNVTRNAFEQNKRDNGKLTIVVHSNSNNFNIEQQLGRKADVILAEIFDCCAFGEGIIRTFLDAHNRLVNPNPIFIPRAFKVYATLIQSEKLYSVHAFDNWRTDYVNSNGKFASEAYWCDGLKNYLDVVYLSEPITISDVDLTNKQLLEQLVEQYVAVHGVSIIKEGTVHSIIVHWIADMADGVILDSTTDGSCWDYGVYPVRRPLSVKKGDVVPISVCLSNEGKRLDIILSGELESGMNDKIRTLSGQYLNLCHNEKFTKFFESSLEPTDYKIFAVQPFNWKAMGAARNRREHAVDCKISAQLSYNPTILIDSPEENVYNSNINLDPPYDRIVLWPFLPDGGFNPYVITEYIPKITHHWHTQYPTSYLPPKVTPEYLHCQGQLFYSDDVANQCRIHPSSHLGVKLKSKDYHMNLFECRDLHLRNLEHKTMSEVFDIIQLPFQEYFFDPQLIQRGEGTYTIPIACNDDGEVDGVIYWWRCKDFNSRDLPCASFVFNERLQVRKGQYLDIRVDFSHGHLLISN